MHSLILYNRFEIICMWVCHWVWCGRRLHGAQHTGKGQGLWINIVVSSSLTPKCNGIFYDSCEWSWIYRCEHQRLEIIQTRTHTCASTSTKRSGKTVNNTSLENLYIWNWWWEIVWISILFLLCVFSSAFLFTRFCAVFIYTYALMKWFSCGDVVLGLYNSIVQWLGRKDVCVVLSGPTIKVAFRSNYLTL